MPPPSSPVIEIEWCGARNGRDRSTPRPARSPATECSWVASSASSRDRLGRIVVMRRASIVLPAPGEPIMSTLCPPAAATSRARRAWVWPRTSRKSTSLGASSSSRRVVDRRRLPRSPEEADHVGRASTPRRPAAGRPAPPRARSTAGTITPSRPARAAAIATESTPGVGISSPLSESSPARANRPSSVGRHLGGRREHAGGDREVEPRSFLAEVARREVHDDAAQRPLEPLALDRGPDALARVANGSAREPGERERGQPSPDVRLDGHEMAAHPEHRDAEHPSVHASDA